MTTLTGDAKDSWLRPVRTTRGPRGGADALRAVCRWRPASGGQHEEIGWHRQCSSTAAGLWVPPRRSLSVPDVGRHRVPRSRACPPQRMISTQVLTGEPPRSLGSRDRRPEASLTRSSVTPLLTPRPWMQSRRSQPDGRMTIVCRAQWDAIAPFGPPSIRLSILVSWVRIPHGPQTCGHASRIESIADGKREASARLSCWAARSWCS